MWKVGIIHIASAGNMAVDIHPASGLAIIGGAWVGWLLWGTSGVVYGIIAVVLLFGCLLLHELAHGLLARRMGLEISRITVLPIGLVIEIPATLPRQEMRIALAGPLANLSTGIGLTVLAYSLNTLVFSSLEKFWISMLAPSPLGALLYLAVLNIFIGLFNLLPAFPMDGGRMLRAGLAFTLNYVTATRIASWLGRILGLLMGVVGIVGIPPLRLSSDPWLVAIAITVYLGARHEELRVRQQWALAHVEVENMYQSPVATISPWDIVTKSLITSLFKHEHVCPVTIDDRVVGILTYQEAHKCLGDIPPTTVAHVMQTNFPTVQLHDTLWVALRIMNSSQLAKIPVVNEDIFQGIITLDDIEQAWRISHLKQKDTDCFPLSDGIS